MMLPVLLLAITSLPAVRPEPVEGRSPAHAVDAASTGSARTAGGDTVLDAERAFAADARTLGQWTAFRKWAAPDATMFVPQPVNAQAWLKDRKDPPRAIDWWPTAAWMSCDGTLAADTGGWRQPDGSVGYFSTVWQRQADGGWKWVLDHGDVLAKPRTRPIFTHVGKAVCQRPFHRSGLIVYDADSPAPVTGTISSRDATLSITWSVFPDLSRTIEVSMARRSKPGTFKLAVYWMPVVTDKVAAAK